MMNTLPSSASVPYSCATGEIEAKLPLPPPFQDGVKKRALSCINLGEEDTIVTARTSKTSATSNEKTRFKLSPSRQCKKIFNVTKVSVPTSFIVLPYELKWDEGAQQLIVPTKDHIELAEQIGKCLLGMNKVTAKFSFWIAMNKQLSKDDFREKLKGWINRARTESTKAVATEMVKEIQCGTAYVNICREVLEREDAQSNAKAYIDDPIRAATDEMEHVIRIMLKCYASAKYFFYLLDEGAWFPVSSSGGISHGGSSYPIHISANTSLFENLFLPFMNISSMSSTAVYGLEGLANMVGLPQAREIPDNWKNAKLGSIHRAHPSSTVATFATLQRVLREKKEQNRLNNSNVERTTAKRNRQPENNVLSELKLLTKFYEDHDQSSSFCGLRQVSDSKGSTLWIRNIALTKTCEENTAESSSRAMHKQNVENGSKMKVIEDKVKLMEILQHLRKKHNRSHSVPSMCTAETELSNSTSIQFSSDRSGKASKMIHHGKKLASCFGMYGCSA